MRTGTLALVILCTAISGCGLWDSGVEWSGGPYVLLWIDDPHDVTLSYDLGKGNSIGRIEKTVFSVGWDGRYVVAKQHPDGGKNVTQYFYIDGNKDKSVADPADVVVGPLSETTFAW
jgi:hypothetical protein